MEVDEDDAELSKCTTAELVEKIRKLKLHVKQLRNVIHKSSEQDDEPEPRHKKARKDRPFNFDIHYRRHVALKVTYLGWDLCGLASQEDSDQTVEAHLFSALARTKLIKSRETCNYHRCGRTDKGVSAFSQVLSLDLRCKQKSGIGVLAPSTSITSGTEDAPEAKLEDEGIEEINYSALLNKVLPKEIRVLAWAPVPSNFSARYDCFRRTYKYYFPAKHIDTKRMLEAAKFLVGIHDFRNFCKLDRTGQKSSVREILDVALEEIGGGDDTDLMALRIVGRSFVWHQIRCIVAILILVAKGLEEPSIVPTLLDIEKYPKKPQYSMAVDFPLVLFHVDHGDVSWIVDKENLKAVEKDLGPIALQHTIKAAMIQNMLAELNAISGGRDKCLVDSLLMGKEGKVHRSLVSRPVCQRTPAEIKKV